MEASLREQAAVRGRAVAATLATAAANAELQASCPLLSPTAFRQGDTKRPISDMMHGVLCIQTYSLHINVVAPEWL
jgi:hypothetical protein